MSETALSTDASVPETTSVRVLGEMVIQVPAWSAYPWLRHGFSTRRGGVSTVYQPQSANDSDLNLGWTIDDDPANVAVNRLLLVAAISGSAATPLFTVRQVHSAGSLAIEGAASFPASSIPRGVPLGKLTAS